MFEQATRMKLRFDTKQGSASVEDLWDLPLKHARKACLDDIAIDLDRRLKDESVSFVDRKEKNPELVLAFEIVKHIINTKQEEASRRNDAEKKRETKARILELIQQKEDDELKSKSADELRKMAEELS